jgi:hypothetical protein
LATFAAGSQAKSLCSLALTARTTVFSSVNPLAFFKTVLRLLSNLPVFGARFAGLPPWHLPALLRGRCPPWGRSCDRRVVRTAGARRLTLTSRKPRAIARSRKRAQWRAACRYYFRRRKPNPLVAPRNYRKPSNKTVCASCPVKSVGQWFAWGLGTISLNGRLGNSGGCRRGTH